MSHHLQTAHQESGAEKNSARMGKESGMEFLPPLPVVLLRFRFIVKYF